MTRNDDKPALYLFTPFAEFVMPYFERYMPEYRITRDPLDAVRAIMVSSTEIYDVPEGDDIDELAPIDTSGTTYRKEQEFKETCRSHGLESPILRCAGIVGTGMNGFTRRIAESIYRGFFLKIDGNPACRSLIHARDIPEAARLVLDKNDTFNVTDKRKNTINDLADALAWRMGQKRLFALSPKWYRLLMGKRKFAEHTRSITFSCGKLDAIGKFDPVSVTKYLKTHVYDDESL